MIYLISHSFIYHHIRRPSMLLKSSLLNWQYACFYSMDDAQYYILILMPVMWVHMFLPWELKTLEAIHQIQCNKTVSIFSPDNICWKFLDRSVKKKKVLRLTKIVVKKEEFISIKCPTLNILFKNLELKNTLYIGIDQNSDSLRIFLCSSTYRSAVNFLNYRWRGVRINTHWYWPTKSLTTLKIILNPLLKYINTCINTENASVQINLSGLTRLKWKFGNNTTLKLILEY